jgi:nitrite reductase (NADH) small subunit
MTAHLVAPVIELPPGARKIVEVEKRSIGVFNVAGEFFAIRNRCPHQGAPLCLGLVTGTMAASSPGTHDWQRDGEIIRCPWHGWEFDIKTGKSIFNPNQTRVKRYDVTVAHSSPADTSLETYPLSVEHGLVLVHL